MPRKVLATSIAAAIRDYRAAVVRLAGTGITDVGLDTISHFKELSYVMLGDTAVSVEGIARLQEKLPNCQVTPP